MLLMMMMMITFPVQTWSSRGRHALFCSAHRLEQKEKIHPSLIATYDFMQPFRVAIVLSLEQWVTENWVLTWTVVYWAWDRHELPSGHQPFCSRVCVSGYWKMFPDEMPRISPLSCWVTLGSSSAMFFTRATVLSSAAIRFFSFPLLSSTAVDFPPEKCFTHR